MPQAAFPRGTVTGVATERGGRVVDEDGFGFIIVPNGEEYFFHRTALSGPAWEGMVPGVSVEFDVTEGKGDAPDEHLRAIAVRLAADAIPAVNSEALPPEKLGGRRPGLVGYRSFGNEARPVKQRALEPPGERSGRNSTAPCSSRSGRTPKR